MFFAAEELNQVSQVIVSNKLAWIVLVPMISSVIIYMVGCRNQLFRNLLSVAVAAYVFREVVLLYPLVQQGILESQYLVLPLIEYSLSLRVDFLSYVFLALMSFIWLLATIFSWPYMVHEHCISRYFAFFIFTLGACLGVVMSGDLIAFFLFFELMTFSSYVLVIHKEDKEAMSAGLLFLVMSIIGGLILLWAIFYILFGTGTVEIMPLLQKINEAGLNQPLIITMFLIGFGVKAGMVPLHIWLPRAHPVAPAPASALLSGLMIKVGAYGILRVTLMIFTGTEILEGAQRYANWSNTFGYVVIWIGVVTMFLGAFLALQQTMAKRILAYSSVSQMGYILMGIGCAAYLGPDGAMGFVGAIYHIINHALFKAGLFMMVGAIYIHTHELDIDKIGGMIKKFPFIAGTFLVAAFGIGGIPGFNGYTSKTLVHHAIEKAYHLNGDPALFVAEKIFVLTSALTVCYFIKLFRGMFLGEVPEKFNKVYKPSILEYIPLGIFAGCIIFIGLFPQVLYQNLVIPAMRGFTFDPYNIEKYILDLNFFAWPDIRAILIVLALVAVIYPLGTKYNLFKLKFPVWLSIEHSIFRVLAAIGWQICVFSQKYLDSGVNNFYNMSSKTLRKAADFTGNFEGKLLDFYEGSSSISPKAQAVGRLLDLYEDSDILAMVQDADKEYREKRVLGWNIKNINIAAMIMAFLISMFLFIFFLYHYTR